MSKNTRDTLFRKVDVDQYSEDKFEEDEQGDGTVNGVGPNEAEVQTLLSQYPFPVTDVCVEAKVVVANCILSRINYYIVNFGFLSLWPIPCCSRAS